MTLTEAKNEIAGKYDFDTWDQMDKAMSDPDNLFHPLNKYERWQELHGEYAKLYACEKVKEGLKMAADLSQEMVYDKGDCNMMQNVGLAIRNYQTCYATPKQSILSLETELLNSINKEI